MGSPGLVLQAWLLSFLAERHRQNSLGAAGSSGVHSQDDRNPVPGHAALSVGQGCQTEVCRAVRAQKLRDSHRLRGRRPQTAVHPLWVTGSDCPLQTGCLFLPRPRLGPGQLPWTDRAAGVGDGEMWPPETLCRPPEGRSWKKPECPELSPEAGEKTLALRMAELDQSPRALGPDLQARLPQRQLILFFLPIFASQILLPFQAGYLGVPRQPLSPLSLGMGCTPVPRAGSLCCRPLQNIQHHE